MERVWKGTSEPVRKGKIVNTVYETSDYSIFKLHKRNRNVITRDGMVEQAKEGIVNPIMVNGEMIVIDGQNRLHHSIKADVPVKYIIDESLTIDDITRMNTNQEKWTTRDWVESYANEGRKEYEKLIYVLNNFYPTIIATANIGANSLNNKHTDTLLKSGKFRFHSYEMTISFFHYWKRFKEETGIDNNSPVVQSLYRLFRLKKFNKDRLIKKIIACRFDEELKNKRLTQTGVIKGFLDSYNDRLTDKGDRRIQFHIDSKGTLIIDEDMENWANKKIVLDNDL